MKKITTLFTILVLFQLISINSFAQNRTLCIKGYVVYVEDMNNILSGNVLVGDTINGKIKYDLSITDNNALPSVGDYQNSTPPSGITINLNNRVFKTDSTNVNFLLEVINNNSNSDNIVFRSNKNVFFPEIPSAKANTHISWQLDDTAQTAVSNVNMPTYINLNAWQQNFGLNIEGGNMFMDTTMLIRIMVTSVDTCESTASINDIDVAKNTMSIHPNPFTNTGTIEFNAEMQNAEIEIYNMFGQKTKVINHVSGRRISFNRDDLQSGIYFIHLLKDNKTLANTKLIITD